MTENDKPQFAQMWGGAWAMYGKEATKPILSMAFEALRAYDLGEVRQGLSKHMQNPDSGQFAPKPADVIKHIGGGSDSRALVAWSSVDKAVRRIGTYQTVVSDDPIIHQVVVDMGGWIKLGKTEESEWPFVAKEFERRYRGYLINPMPSYPKQLTGASEAENGSRGIDFKADPVLIGDASKAEQIYLTGSTASQLEATPLSRVAARIGDAPKRLEARTSEAVEGK